MTRRNVFITGIVAACVGVAAWQSSVNASNCGSKSEGKAHAHTTKAKVGGPAPDFVLIDTHGNEHRLSEYRGHVVVLEWINQQCPYIVDHHAKKHTTQKAYAEQAGQGVVWLAIDSTHHRKPAENRVWAAKHRIAYPILHDPHGCVGRVYGAKTTPHIFVIDKHGKIAYHGVIDDRGNQNHANAAVAALLAGKTPPRTETKPYGCSVKYGKVVAKAGNGNGDDQAKTCPLAACHCSDGKSSGNGNGDSCPAAASSCGTKEAAKSGNGDGESCPAAASSCGTSSCGTKKVAKGANGNGDSKKGSCATSACETKSGKTAKADKGNGGNGHGHSHKAKSSCSSSKSGGNGGNGASSAEESCCGTCGGK